MPKDFQVSSREQSIEYRAGLKMDRVHFASLKESYKNREDINMYYSYSYGENDLQDTIIFFSLW